MIEIDLSNMVNIATVHELAIYEEKIAQAHAALEEDYLHKTDLCTGWLDLPDIYSEEELAAILSTADKIRNSCEVFIVLGIGGSYLGSRAALEFILTPEHNRNKGKDAPQVYFSGNNLSARSISGLCNFLSDKDVSLNVVSRSGETLETLIAFRIFRQLLEQKYGKEEAAEHIYVTTNPDKGTLRDLALENGYKIFYLPQNVSGRYSVLTAVGLLPMAVGGIDIREVIRGAREGKRQFSYKKSTNPVWGYVASRHILETKGKNTEIMAYNDPGFRYLGEWWKQLFAESEGKRKGGIFPACIEFPADLHSIGQYIQDGRKNIFETAVCLKRSLEQFAFPKDEVNNDGLDYLNGKDFHFIDTQILIAALVAHAQGGTPSVILYCDNTVERAFGELVYFFELSCAISCYLRGVNPFDQPGVEAYKENLFALIDKPGFEEKKKEILAREIRLRR